MDPPGVAVALRATLGARRPNGRSAPATLSPARTTTDRSVSETGSRILGSKPPTAGHAGDVRGGPAKDGSARGRPLDEAVLEHLAHLVAGQLVDDLEPNRHLVGS